MPETPTHVRTILEAAARDDGLLVILTGAGISAESGIPTFRGEEGYWRVGSRNYQPEEMATWEAFSQMPDEVWAWYLYRRSVCLEAQPNDAHRAVARLEEAFGDRVVLVTQNVDGLHLRAGSSLERTYEIHGNIQYMRCAGRCSSRILPMPEAIDRNWPKGRAITDTERQALRCPQCGGSARPHVLWFDETYDEEHFRFESSIRAARAAELLVVVGTTGQTNLPLQIASLVARRGAPMIAVNPEPTVVTELAQQSSRGAYLEGTAGAWIPEIVEQLGRFV